MGVGVVLAVVGCARRCAGCFFEVLVVAVPVGVDVAVAGVARCDCVADLVAVADRIAVVVDAAVAPGITAGW